MHSAGPAPKVHNGRLGSGFFFDRFLNSMLMDFGAVLGPSWEVILGLLGLQVRPRCLQEGVQKLILVKNADFAPVLRFPIRKLVFGPQDGAQNRPRSAQDGSKTVLEGQLLASEHRVLFWKVLGTILAPFWFPKCLPFALLLASRIGPKFNRKIGK